MPLPQHPQLTAVEARVLGSLIEKEVTTPEYYPLSLNALVSAASQRSNREPVMTLGEEEVREALDGLEQAGLAGQAPGGGRVARYEHRMGEAFNLGRAETALLCVLLLRGPQTPGELRGRTERMYRFGEIGDVLGGLERLERRDPSLVTVLPRAAGARETRYAHLLSGETALPPAAGAPAPGAPETGAQAERIASLEAALAELREEVRALRERIDGAPGSSG